MSYVPYIIYHIIWYNIYHISYHILSYHISHHITSHHITSHHITFMQMYSLDLGIIKRQEGEEIFCSKAESQKDTLYKKKINFRSMYFSRRPPLVLLLKVGCRKNKTLASESMVMGGQVFWVWGRENKCNSDCVWTEFDINICKVGVWRKAFSNFRRFAWEA